MSSKNDWKDSIKGKLVAHYTDPAITDEQLTQIDTLLNKHWDLQLTKNAYGFSRFGGVLAVSGSALLDLSTYLPDMVDPVFGRALTLALAYMAGQKGLQYTLPHVIPAIDVLNKGDLTAIFPVAPGVPALIRRLEAINVDLEKTLKKDEQKTWLDAAGTFLGACVGASRDTDPAVVSPSAGKFSVAGAFALSIPFFGVDEVGAAGIKTHWRDDLRMDEIRRRRREAEEADAHGAGDQPLPASRPAY